MGTQAPDQDLDEIRQKYPISQHERDFIEWLVTPDVDREIRTQKEWAESRGFHEKTPSVWKKDVWFRKALDMRYTQLNISPDRVQRIIDALQKKAEGGDVQAAKLMLDYLRDLMPREKHIAEKHASDMSDDELRQALRDAADGLE